MGTDRGQTLQKWGPWRCLSVCFIRKYNKIYCSAHFPQLNANIHAYSQLIAYVLTLTFILAMMTFPSGSAQQNSGYTHAIAVFKIMSSLVIRFRQIQ